MAALTSTTTKLTKCIYGFETNPKKTPFGLMNNQIRGNGIIQSAGWFNINGERLGGGDLTLQDMQNISQNISLSESFFVLTEVDAGWDLPSDLDRTAPGFPYILQKAVWVMAKGPTSRSALIIRVRDDISKPEETEKDGVKFIRIPRNEFYAAFGYDKSGVKIPKMKKLVAKKPEQDDDAKDVVVSPVKKSSLTSAVIPSVPPTKGVVRRTYTSSIKPSTTKPASP